MLALSEEGKLDENNGQTGGVNISGVGNVTVGGDIVGRDKVVETGISGVELDRIFAPLVDAVRNAALENRREATQQIEALKNQAAKGSGASDSVIAQLVEGIVGLVPKAVSALVSAFSTPILGSLAGPATKYVLDKIQTH